MRHTFRCELCGRRAARHAREVRTWREHYDVVGVSDERVADLCPPCAREYDLDPERIQVSMRRRQQARFWTLAGLLIVVLAAGIGALWLGVGR